MPPDNYLCLRGPYSLQGILLSAWEVLLSRFESWMAGAAHSDSYFESSAVIVRASSEYSHFWCTGCADVLSNNWCFWVTLFFFFLWLVIPSICPRFCYNQQFLEFSVMISTEADFVPHTYFLWLSHNSPASRKFYQWSLRLCQKCCELVGFSLSGHHWGSTTPKYV